MTVKGGTKQDRGVLRAGRGLDLATGKGTITNMGAELGANHSIFPYDRRMKTYPTPPGAPHRDPGRGHRDLLTADPEVEAAPESSSTRSSEIDLDALEPHIVGPHSPDLARPVSRMASDVAANGYRTG